MFSSLRNQALRLGVLALLAVACNDDKGSGPAIDLQNSWPNEDGRFWAYELDGAFFADSVAVTVYDTPAEVPPAPTLAEAIQLLQAALPSKPARTQHAQYVLQFAGTDTTESGATGQNLESTLDGQPVAALAAGGAARWSNSAFTAGLRRARPDLWRRLQTGPAGALIRADSFEVLPGTLLFLSGGAWEKGMERIVRYGPLDLDPSWQYLEANLRIGHEFSLQLIKSLASDVFLHARMHRYLTVTTQAGVYANALEVVYLVDFGIAAILGGPGGQPMGYARGFAVGTVVYSPSVGPIWSEERGIYFVGDGSPTGPEAFLLSNLQATGIP